MTWLRLGAMVPGMTGRVEKIYRYPVKGLSAEALDSVALAEGQALPNDRRFALALGSTPYDQAKSEWLPKTSFLMLMRNEKLATLETRFDNETESLSIFRGGKQVVRGKLTDRVGRSMIEEFFAAYMGAEARGWPRVVEGSSERVLSDSRSAVISLINLASVRDMERVVGGPVDPLRFRGNIYFEAEAPWVEFGWVKREIAVGRVRFSVVKRIERCAATNVNPETAGRDLNIPQALQRGYGHIDCGIYAKVTSAGTIAAGDHVVAPD